MRRILAMIAACAMVSSSHALAPPPDFGAGGGAAAAAGFAQALKPRQFSFPLDLGAHPQYRHEWWYVTGHLQAPDGGRFGFELTFFRYALAPPSGSAAGRGDSRWRTRQIYMAHFAVTDPGQRRFVYFERFARASLGLSGAQAAPLRVWLGDWSLAQHGAAWRLQAATAEYTLNLDLRPLMQPVLNGDHGLSRKSSTSSAASYYFSIPRIAVSGSIVRQGAALPVHGLAWLDREWGSTALAPQEAGWDWFALQFDDHSTLMFYALRNRDGSRDPISSGTWVAADGTTRTLDSSQVQIDVLGHWTSPRGGTYPARWRVRVPSLGLAVDVRPVLADQELDTHPRYWEGDADLTGTRAGQPVKGMGYVELVGYARPR